MKPWDSDLVDVTGPTELSSAHGRPMPFLEDIKKIRTTAKSWVRPATDTGLLVCSVDSIYEVALSNFYYKRGVSLDSEKKFYSRYDWTRWGLGSVAQALQKTIPRIQIVSGVNLHYHEHTKVRDTFETFQLPIWSSQWMNFSNIDYNLRSCC